MTLSAYEICCFDHGKSAGSQLTQLELLRTPAAWAWRCGLGARSVCLLHLVALLRLPSFFRFDVLV